MALKPFGADDPKVTRPGYGIGPPLSPYQIGRRCRKPTATPKNKNARR